MRPTTALAKRISDRNPIDALIDFFRLQGQLEAFQRQPFSWFSMFLGLTTTPTQLDDTASTYGEVRKENFYFVESEISPKVPSLVYRYHLPKSLRYLHIDDCCESNASSTIRLSTYTSILDEVSTWSMILGTLENPRPGVSVITQTEWGPGAKLSPSLDDPTTDRCVEIVTSLTKIGKTMGFLRSEIKNPETYQTICYFQHVKFLDPGWMLRLLLTPLGRWCLNFSSKYILPLLFNSQSAEKRDVVEDGVLDSFHMNDDGTATFRVGSKHTNGFGGLHGGVQAILMENLGRRVARQHLVSSKLATYENFRNGSNDLRCDKIFVSYQSSASKKLKIQAYLMDVNPCGRRVNIRIVIERDMDSESARSAVVSEGVLDFVLLDSSDDG